MLSAVHEDSKPEVESTSIPTAPESDEPSENNSETNGTEGGQKKKKFSRSASIVEEMENRVLPEVKIWKEYENEGWARLTDRHREFAKDCADR